MVKIEASYVNPKLGPHRVCEFRLVVGLSLGIGIGWWLLAVGYFDSKSKSTQKISDMLMISLGKEQFYPHAGGPA